MTAVFRPVPSTGRAARSPIVGVGERVGIVGVDTVISRARPQKRAVAPSTYRGAARLKRARRELGGVCVRGQCVSIRPLLRWAREGRGWEMGGGGRRGQGDGEKRYGRRREMGKGGAVVSVVHGTSSKNTPITPAPSSSAASPPPSLPTLHSALPMSSQGPEDFAAAGACQPSAVPRSGHVGVVPVKENVGLGREVGGGGGRIGAVQQSRWRQRDRGGTGGGHRTVDIGGGDGGEKTAGHTVTQPDSATCSIPDTLPLSAVLRHDPEPVPTPTATSHTPAGHPSRTPNEGLSEFDYLSWTYLLWRQGLKGRVEFKMWTSTYLPIPSAAGFVPCAPGTHVSRRKSVGFPQVFDALVTDPAERLIHLKLRKRGAWLGHHFCRGRCQCNHQEWFRLSRAGGLKRVKQLVERCLVRGDKLGKCVQLDFKC
ncbi:hypothetical protein DFH08DRAFT_799781 [Mycena albidolilacea]|uniref:Uncharacterized protein n=1 Tax=Mycena albidolilacea TaxID=1033008 RepID=A0AAD7F3D2_9AGAR|nr:hypothetical protein DFH08DRAFT_799781 [Mycena albidolilacea]